MVIYKVSNIKLFYYYDIIYILNNTIQVNDQRNNETI